MLLKIIFIFFTGIFTGAILFNLANVLSKFVGIGRRYPQSRKSLKTFKLFLETFSLQLDFLG